MRLRRRLALGPILLLAMMGLSLGSGGITAQAAVNTYTIGVDNASPTGRLFMYTDFFPRGDISAPTKVKSLDIIDFKWSTGSADGFHTTTLIKTTDTPAAVYADPTLGPVVPDADDGAGSAMENPAVDNSSGLSPANCGAAVGTPCTFDGLSRVNSGAFPTAPGHDFFVKITAAAGTAVNFLCLIHPGMVGSLAVVAPGSESTPAAVTAAGAAQLTADTTEAVAAAAGVTVPAATTNTNGTKTFNVIAGAETPHEQVLEFFPSSLNITAGDSVKWTSVVHDIHTATFPDNASSAVDDFHHFVCEGTPDTPAPAPPTPCTVPTDFEAHWTPGPAGGTVLANPTTVATTGVLAAAPLPFPDNYTFSVTSAGTYTYHCTVHDHMAGEVLAAAAPALPATGNRTSALPQTPPGNQAPPIAALAILGLAVLVGIGIRGMRSSA